MWTKINIPDQHGKIMIVTGANAGVGFESALALYEAGAHVILASRDREKTEEARVKIQDLKGRGTLETAQLDLSSLSLVKQFAGQILKKHQQLHVLINNAGVMIPPASKTEDGYELQFGVNFLGHFALTGLLYPLLKKTPGSRIVTVSSLAYLRGAIDFDNLKSEKDYDPTREYSQSKLADLLFARELQRRIVAAGDPVLSIAAQPGANRTELTRHMTEEALAEGIRRVGQLMDPWQGALPSLYAAVSADAAGGKLYGPDKDGGYRGYPAEATITPNGLDETVGRKLWDFAEEASGVRFPAEELV
jgi:NAD(P)-dependent dehydrogenase (short-subunit alcohol dehydrogenase family)